MLSNFLLFLETLKYPSQPNLNWLCLEGCRNHHAMMDFDSKIAALKRPYITLKIGTLRHLFLPICLEEPIVILDPQCEKETDPRPFVHLLAKRMFFSTIYRFRKRIYHST